MKLPSLSLSPKPEFRPLHRVVPLPHRASCPGEVGESSSTKHHAESNVTPPALPKATHIYSTHVRVRKHHKTDGKKTKGVIGVALPCTASHLTLPHHLQRNRISSSQEGDKPRARSTHQPTCCPLTPLIVVEPPSGLSSQRRQNARVPKVLLMCDRSCLALGRRRGTRGALKSFM